MRRWLLAIFPAVSSLLASAAPPEAILVVVGDQHSAYERTAQFVARVEVLKKENPGVPLAVLLDGDTFEQGNVVAKRSGGAIEFAMFRALAACAPTVLNLGNHEPEFFDVAETVRRVQATGVIVIGSIADRATGKLFAPASTHLRLGEVEMVVAGVTTDLLAQYRAAVRPTLDVANPAVWAKENFPKIFAWERGRLARNSVEAGGPPALPRQPAQSVAIVLSHAGLKYDREMFAVVPDGALFAGAHDHVRFVQQLGRTVYFHSGSWNGFLSVARLHREAAGAHPTWDVEQIAIGASDPADPELAAVIRATKEKFLTPDDLAVVGHLPAALPRAEAARWAVGAVRRAAGVDAAFVGNTTFGDGLPGGEVSRVALDACVRFDGEICVAEVSGAQLRMWLAAANQDEHTPFAQRLDEALIADGPALADIADEKTYRIATTDWGMKNRARYFGSEAVAFAEHPELRLKAIVAKALSE